MVIARSGILATGINWTGIKVKIMKSIKAFFALAALLSFASTAQAAPCMSVSGTSGCQLGSTNNDFVSDPLRVNLDEMFGFSDWIYDAKDNDINGVDNGVNNLGLNLSGDQQSGSWSLLASAFSQYSDIMLVFKGGAGNTDPDVYVGFLLSATSGDYESPFTNPSSGNLKNISHVSIYGRGTGSGTMVPEPGLLVLFGVGALALGLGRRLSA